jgi:hypothetical protein
MARPVTLATFAVLLFASVSARADLWTTYDNARFQFAVCYPPDLLHPARELQNGDGQIFTTSDGLTEMRAFAGIDDRGPATIMADVAATLSGPSGRVTSSTMRPGWFAMSGRNGQKVFYTKVILRGDVFKAFWIAYPEFQANIFDAVAARLSHCFRG